MDGAGRIAGDDGLTLVGSVIFGADAMVARWVQRRIPAMVISEGVRALGVWKRDRVVAGVIYERFNGVHCEVSIAAETGSGWADRMTLHALFFYPFVTLGCEAISVVVPQSNLWSLNLATKLGFQPEAIIGFAAPDGGPLVVLKMFRTQCRWLHDGQRRQQGTDPT